MIPDDLESLERLCADVLTGPATPQLARYRFRNIHGGYLTVSGRTGSKEDAHLSHPITPSTAFIVAAGFSRLYPVGGHWSAERIEDAPEASQAPIVAETGSQTAKPTTPEDYINAHAGDWEPEPRPEHPLMRIVREIREEEAARHAD